MWECGLKLWYVARVSLYPRHSLCGSVDWNHPVQNYLTGLQCHSLCGSVDWNCKFKAQCRAQRESLLMWECGLKPYHIDSVCKETCHSLCGSVDWNILQCMPFDSKRQSLLMWECGLKLWYDQQGWVPESHSLCGSVDWNKAGAISQDDYKVTPYVGVWIET